MDAHLKINDILEDWGLTPVRKHYEYQKEFGWMMEERDSFKNTKDQLVAEMMVSIFRSSYSEVVEIENFDLFIKKTGYGTILEAEDKWISELLCIMGDYSKKYSSKLFVDYNLSLATITKMLEKEEQMKRYMEKRQGEEKWVELQLTRLFQPEDFREQMRKIIYEEMEKIHNKLEGTEHLSKLKRELIGVLGEMYEEYQTKLKN